MEHIRNLFAKIVLVHETDDFTIYFRAPTDTNGYSRSAMITSGDSWTQNTGYAEFKTQYSTMPTAGALYTTRPIQYIGATDQNYTNGYFYISQQINYLNLIIALILFC